MTDDDIFERWCASGTHETLGEFTELMSGRDEAAQLSTVLEGWPVYLLADCANVVVEGNRFYGCPSDRHRFMP